MLKIGITERGDPSFDFAWLGKCREAARKERALDGAIVLTKNLTKRVRDGILELHSLGFPVILHCGCTGNGSTAVEPHIPAPDVQVQALADLIAAGFPARRCVLRVDPIIPTKIGISNAARVLHWTDQAVGLDKIRVRFSVMDDYRHVKERFRAAGLCQVYEGQSFHAPAAAFKSVKELFSAFPEILFYTCAESKQFMDAPNIITDTGCISRDDVMIMGLDPAKLASGENPQNRKNCHCIPGKTELLTRKGQCPGGCLYCYWKD